MVKLTRDVYYRSSQLLVRVHLVYFPLGVRFRKRHHLLTKMPNHPTSHRKVLRHHPTNTDVQIPVSTYSASGERSSLDLCGPNELTALMMANSQSMDLNETPAPDTYSGWIVVLHTPGSCWIEMQLIDESPSSAQMTYS